MPWIKNSDLLTRSIAASFKLSRAQYRRRLRQIGRGWQATIGCLSVPIVSPQIIGTAYLWLIDHFRRRKRSGLIRFGEQLCLKEQMQIWDRPAAAGQAMSIRNGAKSLRSLFKSTWTDFLSGPENAKSEVALARLALSARVPFDQKGAKHEENIQLCFYSAGFSGDSRDIGDFFAFAEDCQWIEFALIRLWRVHFPLILDHWMVASPVAGQLNRRSSFAGALNLFFQFWMQFFW